MNNSPLCMVCDEPFDLAEGPVMFCDPCESWIHEGCGEDKLIQNRHYFFCKGCNEYP